MSTATTEATRMAATLRRRASRLRVGAAMSTDPLERRELSTLAEQASRAAHRLEMAATAARPDCEPF